MEPLFDEEFRGRLRALFAWRRDVRRFRKDPVEPGMIDELLDMACLAPSVGNSQPWRFVVVADPGRRARVLENFVACNADALADYSPERAARYAGLKLAGLAEAPVHLVVFTDEATEAGHGLGRRTMPQTLHDSAVTAVYAFWLAARAHGLGVGWVSILEPEQIRRIMDVPVSWSLVAYLCVGYPEEQHLDPELERHGWQAREPRSHLVIRR